VDAACTGRFFCNCFILQDKKPQKQNGFEETKIRIKPFYLVMRMLK
jgi:hypothetical protein